MSLELYLEEHNEIAVLTLKGAILANSTEHLKNAIDILLENGYSRIVIDCKALVSINSSGLATLYELVRTLTNHNDEGRVVLCHVAPQIQELLQISGLDRFIQTTADRDDALEKVMH